MKERLLPIILLVSIFSGCSNTSDDNSFDVGANMVKIEKAKVIAYFPKDSLGESRMNEVVDSLNLGIDSAMKLIGGPLEWQAFSDKPITYYFEPGKFVSITDVKGDVYIPLFRIQYHQAPWLHETMHVLLRNRKGNWNEINKLETYFTMPIWFSEGMAEYLALKVETVYSIKKFDLMKFGGYKKVDSSCYKALTLDSDLLSHIGASGVPTKLLTDRKTFAPPFYTCSCSFVKFLAEQHGLNKMLQANAAFQSEQETIELLIGKDLPTLKNEWIRFLQSSSIRKGVNY